MRADAGGKRHEAKEQSVFSAEARSLAEPRAYDLTFLETCSLPCDPWLH